MMWTVAVGRSCIKEMPHQVAELCDRLDEYKEKGRVCCIQTSELNELVGNALFFFLF